MSQFSHTFPTRAIRATNLAYEAGPASAGGAPGRRASSYRRVCSAAATVLFNSARSAHFSTHAVAAPDRSSRTQTS
jgi:hypothetical protein